MAYHIDKSTNELVLDGWENGIAPSPYKGVANVRNLNASYYPGVAYSNYRRQASTITSAVPQVFLDNFNPGTTSTGATTVTYNHTCTGQNRLLIVATQTQDGDSITSVTYGGISMTLIGSSALGNDPSERIALYGLLNPLSGSNAVLVTRNNSSSLMGACSVSYVGVKQTAFPDNTVTNTGTTSVTTTLTTIANNCYVLSYSTGAGTMSAGTGSTLIGNPDRLLDPVTFSSTTTWTCPVGVTSVQIEAWGAGGGSPSNTLTTTGGGGGGAYAEKYNVTVVPGTVYTVTVGTGSNGADGGDSWFSTSGTVLAKGGKHGTSLNPTGAGGAGGASGSCIGDVVFSGGNGAPGGSGTYGGGGGGGGADSGGAGSSATNTSGAAPGSGGIAGGGGNGSGTNTAQNGTTVGGGSGANSTPGVLTKGGDGFIRLTYTIIASPSFGLFSYSSNPVTTPVSVSMTTTSSVGGSTAGQIMVSFAATAATAGMTNPVQKATSPAGISYILDDSGNVWKQNGVNSPGFTEIGNGVGRLAKGSGGIAYWQNYIVVFGANVVEFCGNGTGDAAITAANWNLSGYGAANNIATFTTTVSSHPTELFVVNLDAYPRFTVNDPVTFTTTGTLPTGLILGKTYYILTIDTTNYQFITVSDTVGGTVITMLSDGTGTQTITDNAVVVPIGNSTNLVFSGSGGFVGNTQLTIISYVNRAGQTVLADWKEATGLYNLVMSDGQKIPANFNNGSAIINLLSPLLYLATGAVSIEFLNPSVSFYRPYVSKVDGSLYFCNGQFIGRIAPVSNPNVSFNPALPISYSVSFGVTSIPEPRLDTVVDMVDLKSQLIVAGQKDIYVWDYISPQTSAPSPVGESIVAITNLLNNIYILAGTKGNIYVSNGYSAQLMYKIPDHLTGVIDPIWLYGSLMTHRSRLYFQALAQTTSGTNILAGIFSLIVSPSLTGEVASGLVMESQNSYGLTPAAGALQNGVLIDNETWSSGIDSFYSAWSNGATTGGIDYNDNTEWQNFEPIIETDIVPIGTILNIRALGNIQFKLDRPMATGDQISLYWRASLSDAYTLIGTTTTSVLSDYYRSNVEQAQWAQFKIAMKCAASGSSRIPLREVRIQLA